jgi:hypothetical protein
MGEDQPRRLSRNETHDLGMIIKERAKVLKSYASEQAAKCMADFEAKLAAEYHWDQDAAWKAATKEAMAVVAASQDIIAKRCQEIGIPAAFAPTLALSWQSRGENMLESRRRELRRVAESQISAMTKSALTKIDKQALDLRTQVVSMGIVSENARAFLESLAPIEEAMSMLEFSEVEKRLETEQQRLADHRRHYGGSL